MGKGNDRNQPCPCGSGKKYKHCHLDREEKKPIQSREMDKIMRKSFGKEMCMVSSIFPNECSNNIIRAHTVSKSANLKLIAENGHVYSYAFSIHELHKSGGELKLKLVGINEASTFLGFCGYHDNKLFAPLDEKQFVGDMEQLFLLSYRGLSRELYTKYTSLNFMQKSLEFYAGKPTHQQATIQQMIQGIIQGISLAIRDLDLVFIDYNKTVLTKNYDKSEYAYCCINLDEIPPVMCSGAIFPKYDFQGKLIQNLGDQSLYLDEIVFNSISIGNNKGAFVIFGRKNQRTIDFINSFDKLSSDKKISTFIKFIFTRSENLFVNPNRRDNLDSHSKKILKDSLCKNTVNESEPTDLLPIDIKGLTIGIESIYYNIAA